MQAPGKGTQYIFVDKEGLQERDAFITSHKIATSQCQGPPPQHHMSRTTC